VVVTVKRLTILFKRPACRAARPRPRSRAYICWAGQATAYKIGMIKILELRQRAKDKLGDRFDLKEFHTLCWAMAACRSRFWSAWLTIISCVSPNKLILGGWMKTFAYLFCF